MTQQKQQLEMVRYGDLQVGVPTIADGYVLRQYEDSDRGSYWKLFAEVFKTNSRLDNLRSAALPGGFFIVEHEPSSTVVASSVAADYVRNGHTETGSLQWVMADDSHLGKGLGKITVAAATNRLAQGEYERVYLSTDDWRLPAIHVYLSLGWKPLIYADDMQDRWDTVVQNLGRPENSVEYINEPR